jgi:hypothetical protein
MYTLGGTSEGAEGNAVSTDASGELQREVRYDADRPWGATLRRHSYIWARMAQDMMEMIGVTMDDERLLQISGEDNAWKFFSVRPEMFQGRVQIKPQPESAVIESRQDKQNRISNLFAMQMIPPDVALQAMNYPDLVRMMRPNKEAYSLSQRENAELAMGIPSPVLPEHDHATHLTEHKKVQQTMEYRNWPEPLKNNFRLHIMYHEAMLPRAGYARCYGDGTSGASSSNARWRWSTPVPTPRRTPTQVVGTETPTTYQQRDRNPAS